MNLKQQLLHELRVQNEEAKAAIAKLEDEIEAEYFARSTITGGAFSTTARNACDNRAQIAANRKNALVAKNKWVSEMLAQYGGKE